MTDVDVRADGDDAYVAVLSAAGTADALADQGDAREGDAGGGERRVRLVVPAELLEEMGLRPTDAPFLARAAAEVLAEDEEPLPAEVSLPELDRSRPGFLERVRSASGR